MSLQTELEQVLNRFEIMEYGLPSLGNLDTTKQRLTTAILATVSKHLPEKRLHDIENGTKRYSDAGKDMWGNHYADLFNSKIDGRNTAITEMKKILGENNKQPYSTNDASSEIHGKQQ